MLFCIQRKSTPLCAKNFHIPISKGSLVYPSRILLETTKKTDEMLWIYGIFAIYPETVMKNIGSCDNDHKRGTLEDEGYGKTAEKNWKNDRVKFCQHMQKNPLLKCGFFEL